MASEGSCSGPRDASSVCSEHSSSAEGGDGAPPSAIARVKPLTEWGRPRPGSAANSLLPPHGRAQRLQEEARPHPRPLKVMQKPSDPVTRAFQRDREREGPNLDVFYTLMQSCFVPEEPLGSCDACLV